MRTARNAFAFAALCSALSSFAADPADTASTDTIGPNAQVLIDSLTRAYEDSVEASFTYQHGEVPLSNGVATLQLPAGFKFLDEAQSSHVVVDLWDNPDAAGVLGIIFPEQDGVLTNGSYAFVVQYNDIGYVEDDDADEIDYDDLLKQIQEEEIEENKRRVELGYEPANTVGWAAQPFYDKVNKVLHWAMDIQVGDSAREHTLNYNVRVLGRKGVLVLNAVAGVSQLEAVKARIPEMLNVVRFNDGHRYEQYDSKVDDVAAWTIGGLVAGKVLAKVGLFALIAKFGKVIVIALLAAGGAVWKFFGGKKKNDGASLPPAAPQA